MVIKQAFVLAAGFGERMRPLTLTTPKPLLHYRSKPLLTHILDRLDALGTIETVIINGAYLAEQIAAFIAEQKRPYRIIFSHEPEPLDTGGSLNFANHVIKQDEPLLCISGDSYWPADTDFLPAFCAQYDPQKYDFFIGLQDKNTIQGGKGDYDLIADLPIRRPDQSGQYMFNSIRIMQPHLWHSITEKKWSQLRIMDTCQNQKRLGALIMQGWVHLSEPADLNA